MGIVVIVVVVVLQLTSPVICHPAVHVVELTYQIDEQAIFWPGNPNYTFTVLARQFVDPPGIWFENNAFSAPEHVGTHMDSPAHLFKGGYRTQHIPMEKLIGPGVVINVKDKVSADPDYTVNIQDLEAWEDKYGRIPDGAVVVMNSGLTRHYSNRTAVFGSPDVTDSTTFHFPGFHADAADWLVRYRRIHVVAVDTPSTDPGTSRSYPTHVILGRGNIPGVENVANIDAIPESGATIHVAPIKLFDGSGSPIRMYATFTTSSMPNDSSKNTVSIASVIFTVFLTFMLLG